MVSTPGVYCFLNGLLEQAVKFITQTLNGISVYIKHYSPRFAFVLTLWLKVTPS